MTPPTIATVPGLQPPSLESPGSGTDGHRSSGDRDFLARSPSDSDPTADTFEALALSP